MANARLLIVALLGVACAGCAGRGAKSHLARLQSQVGLLDERVTQLERMGVNTAASSFGPSSTEAWPPGAADSGSGTKWKSASGSAGSSSRPTVKVASNKPSTREIQAALKAAGFYQGNVDGKMGPLTRQAVEEFQRINGLTADGVVGKQTWSKLKQYAELSGGEAATYLK